MLLNINIKQIPLKYLIYALIVWMLLGCFSTPPIEVQNVCVLLDEEVRWYQALKRSEKKWGVDKSLQLAFIYQESRFASDARPAREKLFGIIPWFRSSSAYGFAQVKDDTWRWYQSKTGNFSADRNDFSDATDFIGWYVNYHHKKLGIGKNDAYAQYLAYHEGHRGFQRKTHLKKDWLVKIAKSIDYRAQKYKKQLNACGNKLDNNSVWVFW